LPSGGSVGPQMSAEATLLVCLGKLSAQKKRGATSFPAVSC
jgi:hypothetical protein